MREVVRTRHHPAGERLDAFRAAIGSAFVPLEPTFPVGPHTFRAIITADHVGPLHVLDIRATPHTVVRSPRLIGSDDADYFKLVMQAHGSSGLTQDGRRAALAAGDFTVYDTTRPYGLEITEDSRLVVLMFPRTLLRVPLDGMRSLTAVPISGRRGLGGLLSPLLLDLCRRGPVQGPMVAANLGDAALDLLAASFNERLGTGRRLGTESRGGALFVRITAFIDAHLGDLDLDPGIVAEAHHISLSYLHKLFGAQGTSVSRWIRERRLDRCRRDLSDPLLRHESVARIGTRWGFCDAAHFSRTFKEMYGRSPREYRDMTGEDHRSTS